MKIGTKSVLFGAHQFLLHPLFLALAWWQLYGFPWDPRLWVAFFVHDLGYWGKPNMDGPEGEEHPTLGANIMHALFDGRECIFRGGGLCGKRSHHWRNFTLFHSRFMARRHNAQFSRLCVADKLAGCLEPDWLYLARVIFTGEIEEYMGIAMHKEGGKYRVESIEVGAGRRAWRKSVKAYLLRWINEHKDGRSDTWTPTVERSAA